MDIDHWRIIVHIILDKGWKHYYPIKIDEIKLKFEYVLMLPSKNNLLINITSLIMLHIKCHLT